MFSTFANQRTGLGKLAGISMLVLTSVAAAASAYTLANTF
jgi:hypothetical protein